MAGWWERHVVPRLIRRCCGQPQVMKARSRVVPLATGDVFELGCGGGINLPFYDPARMTSFAGCDPSAALLDDTRRITMEMGLDANIQEGVGEAIPFANASFDTVVTTFTLCSVHDPAKVLAEIRRILRPGGTALFLEHGSAPHEAVRSWQRVIEPVWKRIGGGCHLTRPIAGAYEAAGFDTNLMGSGYMPKTPRPMGWIEWGSARV